MFTVERGQWNGLMFRNMVVKPTSSPHQQNRIRQKTAPLLNGGNRQNLNGARNMDANLYQGRFLSGVSRSWNICQQEGDEGEGSSLNNVLVLAMAIPQTDQIVFPFFFRKWPETKHEPRTAEKRPSNSG